MQPRRRTPKTPANDEFTRLIKETIASEPDGLAGILSSFPHKGFVQNNDGEWCSSGQGEVIRLGLFGNQSVAALRARVKELEDGKAS